ncbi:MAG: hypothetical protein H8D23_29825 [Candidatus Brocadiales bacterium]|nr:hypothetical protein [Candidatus Brocadiales bacterium]
MKKLQTNFDTFEGVALFLSFEFQKVTQGIKKGYSSWNILIIRFLFWELVLDWFVK